MSRWCAAPAAPGWRHGSRAWRLSGPWHASTWYGATRAKRWKSSCAATRTPTCSFALAMRCACCRGTSGYSCHNDRGVRVSAKVDYGIRAMVELAAATPRAVKGESLAVSQHVPLNFLENILQQLKAAGLVQTQRGAEGGYRLARPPEEITLADIIRALEGPLANIRGQRPENALFPGPAAPLQQVWIAVRSNLR